MSKVTIGLPTRNRQEYLSLAVKSVLSQTYREIELVVSDNASTDNTLSFLRELADPRLVILEQPANIGMVGNFNACLNHASGDLFLMLSDDDILEPAAIERLSAPFLHGQGSIQAESIGLTWCPCTIINSKGQAQWATSRGPELEDPAELIAGLWNGVRGPRFSSIMLRTADALAVGSYDGDRYGALCDSSNWTKVALRYKQVVCINQPLVQYRSHASSTTSLSACREWQQWGAAQFTDIYINLKSHGLSEKKLRALRKNLLANLTVTVLLPGVGQPNWLFQMVKEVFRSWRYFLTLYVARRLFSEFWKLMQFRRAEGQE
jgi:glycosyltransferase involved in cell wall biosynthesis